MKKRISKIDSIPRVFEDNKAAIRLALTEESQTLKHIVNLCNHYVRKQSKDKEITTDKQLGDFFYKSFTST